MNSRRPANTPAFETHRQRSDTETYRLRLYVLGATEKSVETVARTRAVCKTRLAGRYDLKVIDLYQNPGVAAHDGIIATPTLVKDLSNSDSVLRALGIAA